MELLILIFQELDHAPSQVCLALTCKTFADVANRVDLAPLTRYDPTRESSRVQGTSVYIGNSLLGTEQVTDPAFISELSSCLITWVSCPPPSYTTCVTCDEVQRTNQSSKYRSWKRELENIGLKKKVCQDGFSLMNLFRRWATSNPRPVCPTCVMHDRVHDLLRYRKRRTDMPEMWEDGKPCEPCSEVVPQPYNVHWC